MFPLGSSHICSCPHFCTLYPLHPICACHSQRCKRWHVLGCSPGGRREWEQLCAATARRAGTPHGGAWKAHAQACCCSRSAAARSAGCRCSGGMRTAPSRSCAATSGSPLALVCRPGTGQFGGVGSRLKRGCSQNKHTAARWQGWWPEEEAAAGLPAGTRRAWSCPCPRCRESWRGPPPLARSLLRFAKLTKTIFEAPPLTTRAQCHRGGDTDRIRTCATCVESSAREDGARESSGRGSNLGFLGQPGQQAQQSLCPHHCLHVSW